MPDMYLIYGVNNELMLPGRCIFKNISTIWQGIFHQRDWLTDGMQNYKVTNLIIEQMDGVVKLGRYSVVFMSSVTDAYKK